VERLEAAGDGRVEVSGRWFGVRGRRFVRPTLTLTLGDGGPERRCLAALDHKPWAAQDGEPWMAAFPVDVELASASAIELSVAPDIEIVLRPPQGAAGSARESAVAVQARSPVPKQDTRARRPSARAQDLERLTSRLSSAESAVERERDRRASVESALEEQRAESRKLSAELGRARAELDLARTAQREAEATAGELESARRELRAAGQRYEQLAQEHSRVVNAHASVQSELRERSGALDSARDALEQERERASEALARAQVARPRATQVSGADQDEFDDPEPALVERRRREGAAQRSPGSERRHEMGARPAASPRTERPLNPALRSRPNWAWRGLALLVIVGVVVAVWLVLHSTILH
jgi:hypothetical protein